MEGFDQSRPISDSSRNLAHYTFTPHSAVEIRDLLAKECDKTLFGGLTGAAATWDKIVKAYLAGSEWWTCCILHPAFIHHFHPFFILFHIVLHPYPSPSMQRHLCLAKLCATFPSLSLAGSVSIHNDVLDWPPSLNFPLHMHTLEGNNT